jgi:Fe-S-cluster containining protein
MVSSAADLQAWWRGAAEPSVETALQAMAREAEEAVRARRPVCLSGGNCCRFESFGHGLWLTGLEVAWSLRHMGRMPGTPEVEAAIRRGDCPFLVQGNCTVHPARPLGCRAYFCDGAGAGWQEALLERWHGQVRDLHDRLALPYRYDEWRRLLRDFAAAGVG